MQIFSRIGVEKNAVVVRDRRLGGDGGIGRLRRLRVVESVQRRLENGGRRGGNVGKINRIRKNRKGTAYQIRLFRFEKGGIEGIKAGGRVEKVQGSSENCSFAIVLFAGSAFAVCS